MLQPKVSLFVQPIIKLFLDIYNHILTLRGTNLA